MSSNAATAVRQGKMNEKEAVTVTNVSKEIRKCLQIKHSIGEWNYGSPVLLVMEGCKFKSRLSIDGYFIKFICFKIVPRY